MPPHRWSARLVWGRMLASALWLTVAQGWIEPACGEDWPQFRGPRGNGTWNGPDLPADWPGAGLTPLWQRPIGGGYAGVVVEGQAVITLDRQTSPEEVERVLAFRADDGQPLWEHRYPVRYGQLDYGNGPRAAATIDRGRVYTLGTQGHVHCLDLGTGRVLWSHDLVGELGAVIPTWGLSASPVVWRDLVLIHGGVPGGCLVAFDRLTGKLAWRSGDDPAGYATPIVVPRGNHEQLVAWSPQHVLGFRADTGQLLWQIPYEVTYGVSIAAPIAAGDLVFVSGYWEGSKAIRLGSQPQEATLAWEESKHLQGLMSQPLERAGLVYLLDKSEGLTCFELATGQKLWDDDHQLTARGRNPHASLVWLGQDDRALALNAEGQLVLCRLNREGYREIGRTSLIGPTWAHPALAGNRAFARNDEQLVAVSLEPRPAN